MTTIRDEKENTANINIRVQNKQNGGLKEIVFLLQLFFLLKLRFFWGTDVCVCRKKLTLKLIYTNAYKAHMRCGVMDICLEAELGEPSSNSRRAP